MGLEVVGEGEVSLRKEFAVASELCCRFSINNRVLSLFHLDQCFSIGGSLNRLGEGISYQCLCLGPTPDF